MKRIISVVALVAMSGCSALSPQKPIHIESIAVGSGGDMYSIPANLRILDIRKNSSDYVVCSEPVPDIAMSNALKLALEASQNQAAETSTTVGDNSVTGSISNALGLKGNSDVSTTALELAGRTQIVLLAREFVANNCRARANGWIDDKGFKASQDKVLDQISDMIKAEKAKAEADKAKAEAVGAAVKVELDKKAMANVMEAFGGAKTEFCLSEYDDCVKNAYGDDKKIKACRERLANCSN